MHSESEYLAQRLEELFLNGRWIANTNYQEELGLANWTLASRQHPNLNSIVKLTFHIWYYLQGINTYFKTGILEIKDQFSFDAEAIQDEQAWNDLKIDFLKNAVQLIDSVRALNPQQLEADFFDPRYGNYRRNIDGMLEHAYYHLGQLVLLRKLI